MEKLKIFLVPCFAVAYEQPTQLPMANRPVEDREIKTNSYSLNQRLMLIALLTVLIFYLTIVTGVKG